jgi:M6 family metalloprotease-like protein
MAKVKMGFPSEGSFVGSWTRIDVQIDPKSLLQFDDLEFTVKEGPLGGEFSASRDDSFNSKKPHVMFLAGPKPGKYTVFITSKSTKKAIDKSVFVVNDLWSNLKAGPSFWLRGKVEQPVIGAAWGGGPGGTPQNFNTIPAPPAVRLAIILFDTTSARFPTDAPTLNAIRKKWKDEMVDGVVGADGVSRSAKRYYKELSYDRFDLSAQVFGPVQLSGNWDDYFEIDTRNNKWAPKGSAPQSWITAADSVVDYRNFDTVVFVHKDVPATATTPVKSAWAYGTRQTFTFSELIGTTSTPLMKEFGWISITHNWNDGGRTIHQTMCHELGHTLGLEDLYTPAVGPGRNPIHWDLMEQESRLPYMSLANRLALGWIDSAWVKTFDFASAAGPVDQSVRLSPIEVNGAPPAGSFKGIEVRIADGFNYYFEYRNSQSSQIGDRSLLENKVVLGTDVVSGVFVPPQDRPPILKLNLDSDGDGDVLSNGENYREVDTTDASFPADFTLNVSGNDDTKADLRVRYGVNGRPDPSIRPWPASATRQWQSPDIEVKNARNLMDPTRANVPWAGHPNKVIVRVKDYTVGSAPETLIGSDTKNVPPGAVVEFTTDWTPPTNGGHFCVIAQIPLYISPSAATVVERTELNNRAQSNYDQFISSTASPATREVTDVMVVNPYELPTRIFLRGGQSNPLYRTYIEHTWLLLEPGEQRKVKVMFEYGPVGSKSDEQVFGKVEVKEFGRLPNRFALTGWIEDPRNPLCDHPDLMGGLDALVTTGRATRFEKVNISKTRVEGVVVSAVDKKPVKAGGVILTRWKGEGEKQTFLGSQEIKLVSGQFNEGIEGEWERLTLDYVGMNGYADSQFSTKT